MPGDLDDSELLRRCRAGDDAAWAALYRRHAPAVMRFVLRISGPSVDLDDLVQRVFVEVVEALGRFRGDSSVTSWLYGIATRVVGKHIRSEVRWRRRGPALAAHGEPLGAAGDPAATADARAACEVVMRALQEMDLAHRAVWVMLETEGLSCEEVARALDLPVGTVKSRAWQARRRMLEALAKAGLHAAWGA